MNVLAGPGAQRDLKILIWLKRLEYAEFTVSLQPVKERFGTG
jgi:hypothetical protein